MLKTKHSYHYYKLVKEKKEGRKGGREGGRKEARKEGKKKGEKKKGDFPGGPVGKTPCSQCSGPGFDLWSGN